VFKHHSVKKDFKEKELFSLIYFPFILKKKKISKMHDYDY